MTTQRMPAPPYCLAMLVCDAVHRDPGTGKIFVLGCFSVVFAREFPATQPMCIYTVLTDGYGKTPVSLRIVDADEEGEPLLEANMEVEFNDPRMVAELIFGVGGITFPAPGEYRIQLFAGTEPILERRIVVQQIAVEPQDE